MLLKTFFKSFLGNSPVWYKALIILFLAVNPIIYCCINSFVAGWLLLIEFIFTLAMALKCYPLQPGGLLALEAIIIHMARPESVYKSLLDNFPVLLLLIFMIAAIHFMREMLNFFFLRILMHVRSKTLLSFIFCLSGAVLSAFLDALTVTAVIIAASHGIYHVYHKAITSNADHHEPDDLDQFRSFLRSLLMHGAVGTAIGGVTTLVGEPQNLVVATYMKWSFTDFFMLVAPVSSYTFVAGLLTCVFVEKFKLCGHGAEMPARIHEFLVKTIKEHEITHKEKLDIIIQAILAILLIISLAFHVAAVGLIGLALMILATSLTGITEEHQLGRAFSESLPFTALLSVFFAIIAVIHEQNLFAPLIDFVIKAPANKQPGILFILNGLLSAISDNVFVATVYITEIMEAFKQGLIKQENLNALAVAINTGTNLPSVATPNGQAAFLFLLTSTIAPIIRLSYFRMVWMALPYTIVLSGTGYLAISFYG